MLSPLTTMASVPSSPERLRRVTGKVQGVGFERIRRITGYLVGTMDKWNDAKRAEERDRVKHSLDKNA